jgi:hypothetical protein
MTTVQVEETTLRRQAANPRIYAGVLFGCIIFFYLLPVFLTRTDLYLPLNVEKWAQMLEYSYILRGETSDVVIYGESTAVFGVNPAIVTAETGASVIVLPSTHSVLLMLGEAPLDYYLAHNKRPRTVVLAVAPWNLGDPARSHDVSYDSVALTIRHGSLATLWKAVVSYPAAVSDSGRETLGNMLRGLFHERPLLLPQIRASRGHQPILDVPGLSAPGPCSVGVVDPHDLAYANYFRQKYGKLGYNVVIFVPPVPDCTDSFSAFHETLRGVSDNELITLPRAWFADDRRLVHARQEAVGAISRQLAETLRTHGGN